MASSSGDILPPMRMYLRYAEDLVPTGTAITFEAFQRMMDDLGPPLNVVVKRWARYVSDQFHMADINHDGYISVDEFYIYYYSELKANYPGDQLDCDNEWHSDLRRAFHILSGVHNDLGHAPGSSAVWPPPSHGYCPRNCDHCQRCCVDWSPDGLRCRSIAMDSTAWAALCVNAGFVNGTTMRKSDADVIFHKVRDTNAHMSIHSVYGLFHLIRREPSARDRIQGANVKCRLDYPRFLFALYLLGAKCSRGFSEVVPIVLSHYERVAEAMEAAAPPAPPSTAGVLASLGDAAPAQGGKGAGKRIKGCKAKGYTLNKEEQFRMLGTSWNFRLPSTLPSDAELSPYGSHCSGHG